MDNISLLKGVSQEDSARLIDSCAQISAQVFPFLYFLRENALRNELNIFKRRNRLPISPPVYQPVRIVSEPKQCTEDESNMIVVLVVILGSICQPPPHYLEDGLPVGLRDYYHAGSTLDALSESVATVKIYILAHLYAQQAGIEDDAYSHIAKASQIARRLCIVNNDVRAQWDRAYLVDTCAALEL